MGGSEVSGPLFFWVEPNSARGHRGIAEKKGHDVSCPYGTKMRRNNAETHGSG